ncbi:hypothetical protein E1A91_A13G011200v1 [Gossypium mustelinum]|uniref:Uncharacterized protein n=1 Tax=Gossypium mustelinum TaxID=34275 RepID=A0A5D2WCL3_GOSMU|nr:hypothetical protein E1A91_A13G011200v1 [Gossypium mustelinum]
MVADMVAWRAGGVVADMVVTKDGASVRGKWGVVAKVLPLISKDRSFEEEILEDNITEIKIQKCHVENLQEKRSKLHERREELEAKMKQLKGELDDVTKEIKKTEDLLLDKRYVRGRIIGKFYG